MSTYNSGVGRLATSRFDFEKHITGEAFRQQASTVDVTPITIDGNPCTTVQQAVVALNGGLNTYTPTDATTLAKGIVQLAGDIGGTASSVTVTRLQGRDFAATAPTSNQVISWNGSTWLPSAVPGAFSAGGDLTGTNVSQNVVSLAGSGGSVNMNADTFNFVASLTAPRIAQSQSTTGSGVNLELRSQAGYSVGNNNGGDIILRGGTANGTGLKGGTLIGVTNNYIIQTVEPVVNQKVVSLCSTSKITSTQMPVNTGDRVVYIGDAATAPTANSVGGSILYSESGEIKHRDSSGTTARMSDISGAAVTRWGNFSDLTVSFPGAYEYWTKGTVISPASVSTGVVAYTFDLGNDDLKALYAEVLFIGKEYGEETTHSLVYKQGHIINYQGYAGVPLVSSSASLVDIATGGHSWNVPSLDDAGTTMNFMTGYYSAYQIEWSYFIKISVSKLSF